MIPTFKIMLLGASGTGKTMAVKKSLTGVASDQHIATVGVEVHPLTIGKLCYNVWDVAGDARFGGLKGGYCIGMEGVVIMHRPSVNDSLKEVFSWYRVVKELNAKVPIILYVNTSSVTLDDSKDLLNLALLFDHVVMASAKEGGIEKALAYFGLTE